MVNFSHQTKISAALLKRLRSRWANVAAVNVNGSRFFTTGEGHRPTLVHKRSLDILHDPWFNKGTAFSMTERDRLDLRGLLPNLAAYMTEEEVLKGIIYPSISRIRDITKEVAAAVLKEAIEEDLAEGYRETDARELQKFNKEADIKNFVTNNMWVPDLGA